MILVTGEGSRQLTVQEVCQTGRRDLRPIIFVLNNNGYLIERLLVIPHSLGCKDWYTVRVTTCGQLDTAMSLAARADAGVYIEVVTDTYAAPKLAMQLPGPLQRMTA